MSAWENPALYVVGVETNAETIGELMTFLQEKYSTLVFLHSNTQVGLDYKWGCPVGLIEVVHSQRTRDVKKRMLRRLLYTNKIELGVILTSQKFPENNPLRWWFQSIQLNSLYLTRSIIKEKLPSSVRMIYLSGYPAHISTMLNYLSEHWPNIGKPNLTNLDRLGSSIKRI